MFKKPNLFIVGAPKCGTTSLAAWLAEHPQVFMCRPKEPAYFNHDHPKARNESLNVYESYFADAKEEHRVIGEASTAYLRSLVAVREIVSYSPNAKFIVGLRNPVEMALSWHAQSVYECYEDVESFSEAWDLQEKRRSGLCVPPLCRDVSGLIYGDVCRLGAQVARLLSIVSRERVHFYSLENMRQFPLQTWRGICSFLDIDGSGRSEFPILNERKHVPLAVRLAARTYGDVKRMLGLSKYETGIMSKLKFRKAPTRSIDEKTIERLDDFFRLDTLLLTELIGERIGRSDVGY